MNAKCLTQEVETLGVSIGCSDPTNGQLHIGILYEIETSPYDENENEDENEDKQVKFLHFAQDRRLLNGEPCNGYLSFNLPHLLPEEKTHIAAICETLYNQNQKSIPYSVIFDESSFDEDGNFKLEEDYSGLTCATFVIKVFQKEKIYLINPSSWDATKEDKEWQKSIVEILKNANRISLPTYQLILAKVDAGVPRFRPEEIASAAILDGRPHVRKNLTQTASKIKKMLCPK